MMHHLREVAFEANAVIRLILARANRLSRSFEANCTSSRPRPAVRITLSGPRRMLAEVTRRISWS